MVFSPDGADWHAPARIHESTSGTWRLGVCCQRWKVIEAPSPRWRFLPGGRVLASGGEDQTVRLWDMENSRQSAVLHGHKDVVLAVTFSPDGELVAWTGDQRPRRPALGCPEKSEPRHPSRQGSVFTCMAFTQDSHTLVTGDEHGVVNCGPLAASSRRQ